MIQSIWFSLHHSLRLIVMIGTLFIHSLNFENKQTADIPNRSNCFSIASRSFALVFFPFHLLFSFVLFLILRYTLFGCSFTRGMCNKKGFCCVCVCKWSCWDRLDSIISKLHKMHFHFISAVACDTSTYFIWMKAYTSDTQTCDATATIIHLRFVSLYIAEWKLAHNWQTA